MRAAIVDTVGEPPRPGEAADPVAAEGQAIVEVEAVAINPIEVRVAAGRMGSAQVPYVPGIEGAGVVRQSSRFRPGTRVRFETHLPGFGKNGVMSELAAVEEASLVEIPSEVSSAAAAAAGVVGITARLALMRAGLQPGESVAVLGATGGVGQMAVQLAKTMGAGAVVGVGRDEDTLERLKSRGADATVSLDAVPADGLTEALRQAAGGGVDLVVDTLWGAPAMAAIQALSEEGRLVNVGNSAGTDVQLPLQALRQTRSAVVGLSSGWIDLDAKLDVYRSVLEAIASGTVELDHEAVPLDDVESAWRRQEASPNRKLVVEP